MNRELKAKQRSCFQVNGVSQSYALGGAPVTSATPTLTATPQKAVMLGVLHYQSEDIALINDIVVQGETLMASDQGVPAQMFNPLTTDPRETYAGFTLDGGKSAVIKATVNSSVLNSFTWFCDPIDKAVPNEQEREFANFVFGLGTATATAGDVNTIVGVANRPCTLGKLVLSNHSTSGISEEKIFITSIKIAGDEVLSGDGTQEIPLTSLQANSQAGYGLDLNYEIPYNASVAVTFKNRDAALAAILCGGIFCRA